MDDKKSLRNFLVPDSERERSHNFWVMAQPRSSAPSINAAAYRGFQPLFGAAAGAAAVSPIRHILPQIPTRASNPRTAVSKASLRDPFPNVQRSDPMFSGVHPGVHPGVHSGDPSTREVIWREDFREPPGNEGLDQGEMAESYKFELGSTKGELAKDVFGPTVKPKVQHKNSEDNFDGVNELFMGFASGREPQRMAEGISEARAAIKEIFPKREHKGKSHADRSVSGKKLGVDYRKGSSASEKEISDYSAFPPSSIKTKEVIAPANPIKLKIRCDFKEGHKELMAAVVGKDSSGTKQDASAETMTTASAGSTTPQLQVPARQPSPPGLSHLGLAPPSPQPLPHLTAPVPSPSMNIVRPKTGRAKTNAELKKQLMEKRAVQYLKGQGDGGSQASSPATSHVDVNSPASVQADAPSPLSVQAEGLCSDILDTSEERSSVSRRSEESKAKTCNDATEGQNNSTDQPQVDTKWVVGDMLWARVSGHPWWPCIVSPDPFQQIYTKVISRGHKISFRQYHVQFFGEEGERGWVQETSAIPFEGRTKFENFCQDMIKEHKKEKKNYTVALNRRRAWEVAVSSAEHARTMPRVRRVEEYVVVYDDSAPVASSPTKEGRKEKDSSGPVAKEIATKTKSATKQHRKSSIDDPPAVTARSSETGSPPRKKQRLSDPPREESPSHIKLPKNISNQCIVQFTVFCQKRRESVKNDHPDYDDVQVEDCLQEQWSKLDDETRSRFIPMGSDFTYLSQMMASVGMPKAATGVKRSSRFVKTKKPVNSEKPEKKPVISDRPEKHKSKESVIDDKKQPAVSEEPVREERRSQRVSAEHKQLVEAQKRTIEPEPPKSRRSQNAVNGKTSEAEVSSPAAQSPVGQTAATGIPLKKRGRKSKDYRPPSVEKTLEEAEETDSAKKVSTPTVRKETIATSKPDADEDEDTEEELDDANVCFVCEKATKGIEQCQGPCHGLFHPSCLDGASQASDEGQFQCSECTTDSHKCFVCKQSGEKTLPCSVGDCGRFYHEDCLKTLLPDGGVAGVDRPLSCPLHTCFTCQLKKQDKASTSDDDSDFTDLFICVRCPTAYHMTDSCLSAGSLGLTGKFIVCSKHFEPSKTHSLHTRTSSSWCFNCEKGGSLLYCESCPAAYHTACLDMSVLPSGAWQCPDCSRGKSPLYGDLVWVKFGSYRWWPAEIYHPSSLPLNIQDLPHQVGEFPVCFFGSHDYLWIHRGRVFPFKEGDKCCREADAKGTAKIFDKAMKEAIAVYRMLNPNSKHPTTKSADEEDDAEKTVSRKRKNTDDRGDNEDEDDYDGHDAQGGPKTSTKATPPSDRRAKRSKSKSNSKVLRQMQRQSQVLRLIEPPRLTEDGSALKMVKDHESACFRCGQLGQLILCDKPKCTKAYHMKCIHKSKLPHGMWLCPWHHCHICGKAAIQFCSRCPSSYCTDHVVNNIIFSADHGMTCFGHSDVTRETQSIETTPQLVPLYSDPVPVRKQSRSKDLSDSAKKMRRTKTVPPKKKTMVSRRAVESKSTGVGSDSDSRSDDAPLTIVEDPDPVITKSSKKVKKAKPVTKSRRSDGAGKTKESRRSVSSGQAANLQHDGADLSTSGKKSQARADSPMFDNSDDEFPQLVIDVPTL